VWGFLISAVKNSGKRREAFSPAPGLSGATGAVNIKTLSIKLDLEPSTLMKTLGASRQTIHYYFDEPARLIRSRDPKQRKFWMKLDHVFTLLLALTDKRDRPRAIREWPPRTRPSR
jgi:hypothetical protein